MAKHLKINILKIMIKMHPNLTALTFLFPILFAKSFLRSKSFILLVQNLWLHCGYSVVTLADATSISDDIPTTLLAIS